MKRSRLIELLRRDDRGVAAIEFGAVVVPTIMVMVGMVYIGLLAFGSSVLDTNLNRVAYRVYEWRGALPRQSKPGLSLRSGMPAQSDL